MFRLGLACSLFTCYLFGKVPEDMKGCEQKWKTLESQYKTIEDGLVLLGRASFGSFWGRFDCEKGQIVHSYCRIGSMKSDQPPPAKEMFLPVSRYLKFDLTKDEDGKVKDEDELRIYACFDSANEQVAKVYADKDRTPALFPTGKIFLCTNSPRNSDVIYCDSPLDVLECQSEYNKLVNGRSAWDGLIQFRGGAFGKEASVNLKFDCDKTAKSLKLSQCSIEFFAEEGSRKTVTVPGKFCRMKDTIYTCPKADTPFTQLAGAIHAIAMHNAKNDVTLKGYKACIPTKLAGCKAPWAVITENGKRPTNEDGSVRIAETKKQTFYPYKREPEVWAQFTCADKKLVLSECRAADDWGTMKVADKAVCTKHNNWKADQMIV